MDSLTDYGRTGMCEGAGMKYHKSSDDLCSRAVAFAPGPTTQLIAKIPSRWQRYESWKCPARAYRSTKRRCRTQMQNDLAGASESTGSAIPSEGLNTAFQAEYQGQDGINEKLVEESSDDDEFGDGDDWYTVSESIAQPDRGGSQSNKSVSTLRDADQVVDLAALDGMGREILTGASYEHVVDVDIDKGGVLEDDEDNNDLFCGVGLDALVESEQILQNLKEGLNIETATHVQLSAIPRVLDRRDIVVQSHTGTGKTLAFLLPLLDEIDAESSAVQGIIIAPTRELAMQISRECERISEHTGIRTLALIGGANPARQVEKLRRKQPHVVVGTPGRVAELVEHRELNVRGVGMLVVDEVDQCIQTAMGEDVIYLLKTMMKRTQKVLVSATSDVDSVRSFAGEYLHKPVLLRVGGAQRLPKQIAHWYCVVPARMRIELIRKLMHTDPEPTRAIAFVDDPRRVDIVVERLYRMKIIAGALRGNAHKLERAEVLTAFRKGKINLLVTTEVAARGLDIPEISHVFNIDLPTDGDHYVHRAGRCGRAGNAGNVVNVVTANTAFVIGRLEKELGVTIMRMEPRGGKYAKVMERSRQKSTASERSRKALSNQDTRSSGTGSGYGSTRNRSVASGSMPEEELPGFASAEVVDEAAIMDLVHQLDTETQRSGGVRKKGSVDRSGKRKTSSNHAKGSDSKDATEEKPKVKLRWRDTKNKGKPKRKLKKESNTEGSRKKPESVDKGKADEFTTETSENADRPRGRNESTRPSSKKDIRVRAAKQGWVGNRQ